MENWSIPSKELKLLNNEIHIWQASTNDLDKDEIKSLQEVLSVDELEKSRKFHFEKDRKKYIVARGFLRTILGYYLNVDPNELTFSYNRYGKPMLNGTGVGDCIKFNLSHSGEMVIYAIAINRDVGIDIEFIRPYERADSIVERFFSDTEKKEYRSLPDNLKHDAFFRCWTRKEAYIKAHGKGMSIPFAEFSVTMIPGREIIVTDHNTDQVTKNWFVKDLNTIEKYAGAIAAQGENLEFKYWYCKF